MSVGPRCDWHEYVRECGMNAELVWIERFSEREFFSFASLFIEMGINVIHINTRRAILRGPINWWLLWVFAWYGQWINNGQIKESHRITLTRTHHPNLVLCYDIYSNKKQTHSTYNACVFAYFHVIWNKAGISEWKWMDNKQSFENFQPKYCVY